MWSLLPWMLLLLTLGVGGWWVRARDRRARERQDESERDLREAMQAADQLAREKSELLATVSHEIRNPLNGVIGMSELLLETPLDDEQQHYAGAVRKSARMLLDLLNDVLDYSRAEAGAVEFEAEPTDVRDLAATSVAVFAEPARRKRLDLAAVVDPSVPDRPHLDPLRVRQILVNLVGNAVKFTDSGEVVLEIGWSGATAQRLTARVRDTGIGIAPDQMMRLFQPYQQARASVARVHGGTGLGLAIARRLSEGMGGTLTAHSQAGQGTEFVLELPIHGVDRTDVAARTALAGRTVLVVDGGAATRASVRCALESLGAHAELAADVEEGRTVARRTRPDAILVDADLPDAAALVGERPVLLLAGLGAVDTQQARAKGFAGVIGKPVAPDELRRVLTPRLAEAPAVLERALRPVVVLVVDGNPVNQVVLVTTLRAMGCTVDVTETMDEAEVAMRQRAYDLVLAGTRVPGGDTTLRVSGDTHPDAARPPIIAFTRGERSEWTEVGVDARVQWPPRPGELATTMREWVPDAFGTEG
ncbi:MAG: hypothetical protein H6735_23025 [Alphaproteobacteria bacterium]|nr:hypothetical protein [Alphaproteobacteria bacterium]